MKGWVPLAWDGTRFNAPRTVANEAGLGCAGTPTTTPQLQVTLLEHVLGELPFAAQIGPGTDAETMHLTALLDELPERTLLLADAGFFSFNLALDLLNRGQGFLMRVGADKHLLTELFDEEFVEFRPDQEVWVWTQDAQQQGRAPLRLAAH